MSDTIIEKPFCTIIKPSDFKKIDHDCPLCSFVLRNYDDVLSVKSVGCCEECKTVFYWSNIEKWNKGWRPKKEDVLKLVNNYRYQNGVNKNG